MNIESRIMQLLEAAHRNDGLYLAHRKKSEHVIWLSFKFDSHNAINKFCDYIVKSNIAKASLLKGNLVVDILA